MRVFIDLTEFLAIQNRTGISGCKHLCTVRPKGGEALIHFAAGKFSAA
jgi:hypothetical protein